MDGHYIRQWILNQQYLVEHPYTHAKPGGWAWTNLAGGVPDADATSGTLLALHKLSDTKDFELAWRGIEWLINLQNRDGGMPTFCKGCGALPFNRSSTDITAHAIRAWTTWFDVATPTQQKRITQAIKAAIKFLGKQKSAQASWAPLWFGNQHAIPEENQVYGTTRVLLALLQLQQHFKLSELQTIDLVSTVDWLLQIQNEDGGWGGEGGIESSIEETSLTIDALCSVSLTKRSEFHGVTLPISWSWWQR